MYNFTLLDWIEFLFRIQEILGSDLGLNEDYYEISSWFFSVFDGIF